MIAAADNPDSTTEMALAIARLSPSRTPWMSRCASAFIC
jgi:hypothetical protein